MDTGPRSPEIQVALLAHRQILLQDEIVPFVQATITRLVIYLNAIDAKAPITLLIDSRGGGTLSSLYVCDAIEHSKAEVRGLVVGEAHSAAFRILQACHRRLAYSHASMLFHATSLVSARRIDADDVMDEVRWLQRVQEEQMQVYAARSGQSIEQCRQWSKNEKVFLAPEALELGFLDEVIEPPKR